MRFRHQQKYDASPAEVHAMLSDPSFRQKVCRAQQARTATVEIEPTGVAMSVVVDQTRPSDGIPSFARKIVGDEIRIVQREDWSDASRAALDVSIPGKPGHLKGTITVTGHGVGRGGDHRRRPQGQRSAVGREAGGADLRDAHRSPRGRAQDRAGLARRRPLTLCAPGRRWLGRGRLLSFLRSDVTTTKNHHHDGEHHERAERENCEQHRLVGVQPTEVQRRRRKHRQPMCG